MTIQEEGKAKAIGVCNFYPERMTDLCLHCEIMPMVNQVECHLFFHQKQALETAKEFGIVLEAWGPFAEGGHGMLFKRLYEDNVLGRVTNEQFRMLSSDYNAEQETLTDTIPKKEAQLEKLRASAANVDAFIEKAKRYTAIDRLTPELLRLFIQRIEIGERSKKYSRNATQSIRIIYRDIGTMDSPMLPGEAEPCILPPLTMDSIQKVSA